MDMYAIESPARTPTTRLPRPLVVGHRGASAYRPEHTMMSFELAIELGADYIEPDVLVSRDGALVVRHESELSLTTDIASRPEFAERRSTRCAGGVAVTDWFVEDFDLDELRTLRVVERSPEIRPMNTAYNGKLGIVTLGEVLQLARDRSTVDRSIGVLIELSPRLSGPGEELPHLLVAELRRYGLTSPDSPVMLQSFEHGALKRLRDDLGPEGPRMLQLIGYGQEWDGTVTPEGLRRTAAHADGIAPSHHRLLSRSAHGPLAAASHLVENAHDAGLAVIAWTLSPENAFLPLDLRRGTSPAEHGHSQREAETLLLLGVDGLITDAPDVAVRAKAALSVGLAA